MYLAKSIQLKIFLPPTSSTMTKQILLTILAVKWLLQEEAVTELRGKYTIQKCRSALCLQGVLTVLFLPPMVVYKADNIYQEWVQGCPINSLQLHKKWLV